jgi:hypothetical protein
MFNLITRFCGLSKPLLLAAPGHPLQLVSLKNHLGYLDLLGHLIYLESGLALRKEEI